MFSFFSTDLVIFSATILAAVGSFYLAKGRVLKQAAFEGVKPHSLSQYYGLYVCIWVLVPAILLALIWLFAADPMLLNAAKARLVAAYPKLPDSFLDLKMAQLGNIAAGFIQSTDPVMVAQADLLRQAQASADRARNLTLALVMCTGFFEVSFVSWWNSKQVCLSQPKRRCPSCRWNESPTFSWTSA